VTKHSNLVNVGRKLPQNFVRHPFFDFLIHFFPPRIFAHLARCGAAIFLRAAADIVRLGIAGFQDADADLSDEDLFDDL
jgi:hypothetical protein